jgi:DNA-binding transcriptional ArsR family regulator
MSRHLRVLREAGLVREEGDERDARARVYTLEREAFGGVKGWLEHVESFWSEQLAALRDHVEAKGRTRGG